VVNHRKQCCSYFGTAAIKHETRQQSSSIIGLQLQQPTAATGSYSKGLQLPSLSPGCPTAEPPRPTRGVQCETAVGNRGDHVGKMSTDTAVCKHNAGPAHLGLNTAQTGAATATVTGIIVTGAVARGRRRHHEGDGPAELFYHWARAVSRVTFRSVTPISGAGHGTSRCPVPVPGASRSWDPELD